MVLTMGNAQDYISPQTKDAMRARIIVATVPRAFTGLFPQRPNGGCSHHSLEGRFLFAFVRGSNRFSTTWPTIETDGGLSPQKTLTAPGLDRVRQGDATPGLRISLEQQFWGSVASLGSPCAQVARIVALKFPHDTGRRSEYQRPRMFESNLERSA